MLSRQDNEAMSRVGRGTLMGDLMRQYWIPTLLSSELPSPDSDPVRVKLLSEELIAFRDSNGKVGLIQNNCPHRGASLFFGRNEEAGLRCVYHGWKFAVDGTCVDMPNEPAESDFKHKVKATAYPTRERGGVVWAYLGPRSTPPPLPSIEANLLSEDETMVWCAMREYNWLQALEGDIDTSHAGFLHLGSYTEEDAPPGTFAAYALKHRAPRYAIVDTDYGAMYGAYRPAEEDTYYWRIAHWEFPFFTEPPPVSQLLNGSPPSGLSTLITCAPRSASSIPAYGPAMKLATSSTVIPWSGPATTRAIVPGATSARVTLQARWPVKPAVD